MPLKVQQCRTAKMIVCMCACVTEARGDDADNVGDYAGCKC